MAAAAEVEPPAAAVGAALPFARSTGRGDSTSGGGHPRETGSKLRRVATTTEAGSGGREGGGSRAERLWEGRRRRQVLVHVLVLNQVCS